MTEPPAEPNFTRRGDHFDSIEIRCGRGACRSNLQPIGNGTSPVSHPTYPQPAEMSIGSGALVLDTTFAVEVPSFSDARLTNAIDRAVRRIEMATGLRHAGRGVAGTTKLVVKGRSLLCTYSIAQRR